MRAVILAAGRGTRMGKLTDQIPKTLLCVRGKTFLDHIFDALPAVVTEVIVIIGYRGEKIQEYIGISHKGRSIRYLVQENRNGTGKAILLARPFLESSPERFFIIYGDEIPSAKEMSECLTRPYSWLCHSLTHSVPTTLARIAPDGRILGLSAWRSGFTPPRVADGGVILVDRSIFKYRPRRHPITGEYYLTSMLAPFLKHFPVFAVMGAPDMYFMDARDIDRINQISNTSF